MGKNNILKLNIILLSAIFVCFLLFLPIFILKYQKDMLVSKLRDTYNVLNNGVAAYIIDTRDSYNNKAVYEKGLYIELQNGTYIDMFRNEKGILFVCDVNGFRAPNINGRDVFLFFVNFDNKDMIIPVNFEGNIGSKRIINDGWKMQY